jgi:hypothetical protein
MGNALSTWQLWRAKKRAKTRIRRAVEESRWRDAWDDLMARNFDTSLVDVCVTNWEQMGAYWYFLQHDVFLSQCTTAQLDRLLAVACRKDWWDVADAVLKVGGSETACNDY